MKNRPNLQKVIWIRRKLFGVATAWIAIWAFSLLFDSRRPVLVADLEFSKGYESYCAGDLKSAEKIWLNSLVKFRSNTDKPVRLIVARTAYQLGQLYAKRGDLQRADSLIKECWQIRASILGNTDELTINALIALIECYLKEEDKSELEALVVALDKSLEGSHLKTQDLQVRLSNLGIQCRYGKHFKESETLLKRLCSVAALPPCNVDDLVDCRMSLGFLYRQTHRLREAETELIRCTALCKQLAHGNDLRLANALNALGTVYDREGQPVKAAQAYRKALEIYNNYLLSDQKGWSLKYLVLWNDLQSHYPPAKSFFRQACSEYEKDNKMRTSILVSEKFKDLVQEYRNTEN